MAEDRAVQQPISNANETSAADGLALISAESVTRDAAEKEAQLNQAVNQLTLQSPSLKA